MRWLVFAIAVAGCGDELPVGPQVPTIAPFAATKALTQRPDLAERNAAKLLGLALAAAVDDQESRQHLFAAFASAANAEQKLHLASFLEGRGQPLYGVIARRTGLRRSDVEAAISRVRELEFYMPVSGHRARWTAGVRPTIAVALAEDEPPLAIDGNGNVTQLDREHPPIAPVLVLAPIESNLDDQKSLNLSGRSELACVPRSGESLAAANARCRSASGQPPPSVGHSYVLDGLYMEYVELYGDRCGNECWAWGDPEYELHVRYKNDPDVNVGHYKQCAGAHATSSDNPGVKSNEYRFDMNGRTWLGAVKVLNSAQFDTAATRGYFVEFWEDDHTACREVANAHTQETLGMMLGGYAFGALAWYYVGWPGALAGGALIVTAMVLENNFTSDDFLGVFAEPQGPFTATSNTNQVLLDPTQMIGRARFKLYDATPPAAGATASVKLSYSGLQTPVGSMVYFSAWAVDANGLGASRPVTWTSSNTGVASVDQYGWVSAHAAGDATIYATIDGITGSASLAVLALGEAASVQVTPSSVSINEGQQQVLTVTLHDANGFQLPLSTSMVSWDSGNWNVCDVSPTNLVTTTTSSPDWTQLTARVEDLASEAVSCSVNGGNAYVRSKTASQRSGPRAQWPLKAAKP